jgi:hypothetical protein
VRHVKAARADHRLALNVGCAFLMSFRATDSPSKTRRSWKDQTRGVISQEAFWRRLGWTSLSSCKTGDGLDPANSSNPQALRWFPLNSRFVAAGLSFQAMLRRSYLSQKLTSPIPTKDGGTLHTIQEAWQCNSIN